MKPYSIIIPAVLVALSVYLAIRHLMKTASGYSPPQGEQRTRFDALTQKVPFYPAVHCGIWVVSTWLRHVLPQDKVRRYNEKLRTAGSPGGFDGATFLAIAPLLATVMAVIGALLSYRIGRQLLPGALFGFLCGAVLPFARLDSMISIRKREIITTLPYVIDLIALCMRAGQTFHGALATVTAEMAKAHPLRFELMYMSARISLGASTAEALHSLAERIGLAEVRQFVQSAVRSQQKGSSLADIFSIQANIIRTRRSENAEQIASRAAVAMLGPLMLIFLAVFVVLLGPFGVKAFYGELF